MPFDFQPSLKELYKSYNEVIKILIADFEAREETFPLPIFNEIRAFNDHVAQCYRDDISDDDIKGELQKAKRHISRIIFDCYKFLNVSLFEKVKKFENQTKSIDLTLIDNGLFYPRYRDLKNRTKNKVREARKTESKNNNAAFELYQEAYNLYCELEELIETHGQDIQWARWKFRLKRLLKFLGWLLTAIIAGFLALLISCDYIRTFFHTFCN